MATVALLSLVGLSIASYPNTQQDESANVQADAYAPEPPSAEPVAAVAEAAPVPLAQQLRQIAEETAWRQQILSEQQAITASLESSWSAAGGQSAGSGGGDAKMQIYQRESGNDPNAVNSSSGACGLCQALPCSKMGCSLGDYACQDNWCEMYMAGRYGTWEAAWGFWQANHYW